jgi:hypothetical protein
MSRLDNWALFIQPLRAIGINSGSKDVSEGVEIKWHIKLNVK